MAEVVGGTLSEARGGEVRERRRPDRTEQSEESVGLHAGIVDSSDDAILSKNLNGPSRSEMPARNGCLGAPRPRPSVSPLPSSFHLTAGVN